MGKKALPIVSIVGRPNVGKSTLFNRIIRRRVAVVDDESGVTRDRNHAVTDWNGRSFVLVDTGGLLLESDQIMEGHVREQVEIALQESHLVLFTVDGRSELTADDLLIADLLRRRGATTMLVVTKVESQRIESESQEFASLAHHPIHFVSGLEGMGVGDLLDSVVEKIPPRAPTARSDRIMIAVIGRPNVGKSSIVNALLRQDRMIVSDIPGTTRDAVDTPFRYNDQDFTLVDTAGLRQKSKITKAVEYFSTLRTTRSIERADVALVVLDASGPLTRQDHRVAATPFEAGLATVFLFNKWDLREKETLTSRDEVREAAGHLPDYKHAPSLFVSAKTSQRVSRIPEAVLKVHAAARRRIEDETVEECLARAFAGLSHPYVRGRMIRFRGGRQVGIAPPTFVVTLNRPDAVIESYRRYLANRLRDAFGFPGSPIRLLFRRK